MKQKLQFLGLLIASFLMTGNLLAQSVFVNELHYDNYSGDTGEGIEIAGPAGTDLTGWSIVEYNGNGGGVSGTTNLSGLIPDLQGGFGVIFFPISGLQNGSPDGFALVKNDSEVVQFLSYEGVLTATEGVASGMISTDIGVKEDPAPDAGYSLQLSGSGQQYQDFTWQPAALSTYDAVNNAQDFGGEVVPPTIVINEVDADTPGTDVLEFVELYDGGVGNSSLDGKVVVFFNGSNDLSYNAIDLTGYSTDANGYFVLGNADVENVAIQFNSNGLQNGADAVALYNGTAADFPNGTTVSLDNLLDALVYDTNDADDAGLLVLLNEGQPQINEDGSGDKDAHSSQRFPNGSGGLRNTETYAQALPTPGKANTNITEPVNLVINELDADTPGSDSEEFLELYDGGKGNTPLDGFIVVLFNGNGDLSYNTIDLAGQLTNAGGYFVMGNADVANVNMVVSNNTFQNGADAVAIYQTAAVNFPNGSVITIDNLVDALVYGTDDPQDEELIALLNDGQLQADENAAGNQSLHSLQRIPNGEGGVRNTANYVATDPTPGTENGVEVIVPHGELISIAEARNITDGEMVTVEGTLTVTDQFYGPAYLQDKTGAIAVYDDSVYGNGLFEIGTAIKITATKTSYNGQLELVNAVRVDNLGISNDPIVPLEISLNELSQHPDELVSISNVTFDANQVGDPILGNSNFNISDASGDGVLRIDNGTTDFFGKTVTSNCGQIVGIAADVYFNIIPRKLEDFPCVEDYDPSNGLDISYDETLDVVAWNLEFFGFYSEKDRKAPAPPEVQKQAVKEAILSFNADVIAVEEVVNVQLFEEMINELDGYDYILSDEVSYPNSTDDSFGTQRVGFIYKTDVIKVNDSKALLKSIHPFYNGNDASYITDYPTGESSQFWSSGRLPFMMETTVTLNGKTTDYNFVVVHAKSGAQIEDYQRREYDNAVLKDSLDAYYGNTNLMMLGDFNDDVDQTIVENYTTTKSSYYEFLDSEDYKVVTSTLSDQGFRSTVGFPDMIDHIMISNELYDNYIENSAGVHYDLYDSDYASTTSDHFPVSVRMVLENLSIASVETTNATCNGSATGTATVNADGGISPYTYVWSDGQTTQTATNLTAGTYTVEVTDALSNTANAEVVISEASPLELSLTEDLTVYEGYESTCTSLSVLEISGGSGDYTYEWSTGETTSSITVCPSETTAYTILVTDSNGCSIEGLVNVNVEDISCGNGRWNKKVQVCFRGKSLCVSTYAVPALLRNGGKLGSCDDGGSEVIVVEKVVAYPNPTRGQTTISITGNLNTQAKLQVYDFRGNVIMNQKVHVKEGTTDADLNLGRYRTGIYFVKITGDNFESEVLKILKY